MNAMRNEPRAEQLKCTDLDAVELCFHLLQTGRRSSIAGYEMKYIMYER